MELTFDDFYHCYTNRVNSDSALCQWKKMVKMTEGFLPLDLSRIREATNEYEHEQFIALVQSEIKQLDKTVRESDKVKKALRQTEEYKTAAAARKVKREAAKAAKEARIAEAEALLPTAPPSQEQPEDSENEDEDEEEEKASGSD